MAVFSWPSSLEPEEPQEFWIDQNVITYSSPATGTEVVQELPGTRWRARLSVVKLEINEARDLEGLLTHIARGVDSIALPDHAYPANRRDYPDTATVTGAAEAITVTLSGVTGQIWRGDRFMLGQHLYRIRGYYTPVDGVATIGIQPRLRVAASAQVVKWTGLTCPMRLVDGKQNRPTRRVAGLSDFDIEFVEPLPFLG